ncbi:hypothetical protein [Yoonia sediminilitoris]|nr:hypothetical protein [Yoonia sediminilitoris]
MSVIANFKPVVGDGELRVQLFAAQLADAETQEKMGASHMSDGNT